jgi:hypothetical protein
MSRTGAVAVKELQYLPEKILQDIIDGCPCPNLPTTDVETLDKIFEKKYWKLVESKSLGEEWASQHPEVWMPGTKEFLAGERAEFQLGACGTRAILGYTDTGEQFGKRLYCEREWCPVCGKDNSTAHNRRIASWYPKIAQLYSVGYFVIEFPYKSRARYHSRRALEQAGIKIVSVLKGDYEIKQRRAQGEILRKSDIAEIKARWYNEGLRRWHYFGDAPEDIDEVIAWLTNDGNASTNYNPHLNVLVPGGYLPEEKLKYIQSMLRSALNEPELIVRYSFTDEPGRKWHLLEYVTRATFKDIKWDKFLAGSLFGFRNMHSWGKWDAEPVWGLTDLNSSAKESMRGVDMEAIEKIGKGVSPDTGLPIHWIGKPVSMKYITRLLETKPQECKDYGLGFYKLPNIPVPKYENFESSDMRCHRIENSLQAYIRSLDRCSLDSMMGDDDGHTGTG